MDLVSLMTEGDGDQQQQGKELEQQHYRLFFLEPIGYILVIGNRLSVISYRLSVIGFR